MHRVTVEQLWVGWCESMSYFKARGSLDFSEYSMAEISVRKCLWVTPQQISCKTGTSPKMWKMELFSGTTKLEDCYQNHERI